MNHIYRSLWNEHTGTFVAVSERTPAAGRRGSGAVVDGARRGIAFLLRPLAAALVLAGASSAYALPTGGVVTSGAASIAGTATSLTINQSTPSAALNWNSFNVDRGQSVVFVQPSSTSVALNRVLGADPSNIFGTLSANGRVFLVNPNGILFGQGASVNVGGLVASTLPISDSDFAAGHFRFAGSSTASVVNQGTISADGGFAALVGNTVSNTGTISARLGSVALAAGSGVTLGIGSDNLLSVAVDSGAVNSLASNGGLIQADGGNVLITAASAGQLLGGVVNNSGVVQAQTLDTHNGTIRLLGDMQVGVAQVGGTLDASAPVSGNGGFIETSAAHLKVAAGTQVKAGAAHGASGQWLIDPMDLTIGNSLADSDVLATDIAMALDNATPVTLSSGDTGTVTGLGNTLSPRASTGQGDINVNAPISWTTDAALTLNAYRNINLNANITASSTVSPNLTLNAHAQQSNGQYGSAGGAVNFAPGVSVEVDGATSGVSLSGIAINMAPQSSITLPGNTAMLTIHGVLSMAGATPELTKAAISLPGSQPTLTLSDVPVLTGDASIDVASTSATVTIAGAGYTVINDLGTYDSGTGTGSGLQGIEASLGGNYVLGMSFDTAGTPFTALGAATPFSGVLNGFGHSIDNLNVTSTGGMAGLFAATAGAKISNLGLSNVVVGGDTSMGALVGSASSTIISNVWVAGGSVIANSGTASQMAAGGLVGTLDGTSSVTGGRVTDVLVNGIGQVGGLVGNNAGRISQSYAETQPARFGSIFVMAAADGGGVAQAGGLVGNNSGLIDQSFASIDVRSTDVAGGLVGYQGVGGAISNTYAAEGTINATRVAGGLVGVLAGGTVATSYAKSYDGSDGTVPNGGGLIGQTGSDPSIAVSDSYFVTGAHAYDAVSDAEVYSFGSSGMNGGTAVPYAITGSYAQQSYSNFAFTASDPWIIYEGQSAPMLRAFMTSVTAVVPDQSLVFNGAAQTPDGSGVVYKLNTFGGSYEIPKPSSAIYTESASYFIQPGTPTVTHAGSYAIQGAGQCLTPPANVSGGYAVDVTGTLTVTAAPITLSALSDSKTYSGTDASSQVPTVTGLFTGASLTGLTQAFTNVNAGTTRTLAVVPGYTVADGNGGHDYMVVQTNTATGIITPAPLTITAVANSKTYDGTTLAAAVPTTSGLVNGETLGALTEVYSSPNVTDAKTLSVAPGYTVSTGALTNYSITEVPITAGAVITPASLTISALANSKTYDGTTLAAAVPTATGLVNGETLGGLAEVYSSPNVTGAKSLTVVPGYTVSAGNLDNYAITEVANSVAAVITPASLTISALANSKTYDGTTLAAAVPTATGLVHGETLGGLSEVYSSPNVAGDKSLTVVPGYTVSAGTLDNYAITEVANSVAALITPASLTISAVANSKTYDGTTVAAAIPTATGLVNGETLGGLAEVYSSANVADAKTLTVVLTGYTVSAGALSNYSIATVPNTAGALITPASLTLTAAADSKQYDGTTLSSATPVATGMVNGESITGLSEYFSDPNVVSTKVMKAATGFTVSAGLPSNYTVTTVDNSSAVITAAPLTITALTNTKTYDGTTLAAVTPSVTGLVNSESLTGLHEVYSDPNVVGSKSLSVQPGYSVSAGALTNYSITEVPATSGAVITAAPLTISAVANSKTYDGTTVAAAAPTATGLVNGETLGGLAEVYSSANVADAKTLTVVPTGYTVSAGALSNYSITTVPNTAGALITPASLTLTAAADSKQYDGTTLSSATPVATGMVNGESITGLSEYFSDPNVVSTKVMKAATGFTVSVGLPSNYTVTTVDNSSAVITAAPLTITALTNTKTYDGTTLAAATPSVTGLVNNESLTGLHEVYSDPNVVGSKSLSVQPGYSVNAGALSNYSITEVPATSGAVITAAPLTITAIGNTKTYDGTLSAAATPTVTGLVHGETLTGLAEAYSSPNVTDAKTLNVASGYDVSTGLLSNYDVHLVANSANAVITPAALDVVSQTVMKAFGAPDPGLSAAYQVTGLQGDPLASVLGGVVRNPGVLSGSYLFLAPTVIDTNYVLGTFTSGGALRIMPNVLTSGGVVAPGTGATLPPGTPGIGMAPGFGVTPQLLITPSTLGLPYPLQGLPLTPPVAPAAEPDAKDLLVSNLNVDTLVSAEQSRTASDAH